MKNKFFFLFAFSCLATASSFAQTSNQNNNPSNSTARQSNNSTTQSEPAQISMVMVPTTSLDTTVVPSITIIAPTDDDHSTGKTSASKPKKK